MPPSPSPARASGQLVRRDNPAIEILGALERVPGCAVVAEASANGRGGLDLVYAAEIRMYWEEQRPVRADDARGQLVFIDVNGREVLETELLIRLTDGTTLDPMLPPRAAAS
jgi:hypothetical protein